MLTLPRMLKRTQFVYGIVITDAQHVADKVIDLPCLYLNVRMHYPDTKAANLHSGELFPHHSINSVSNNAASNVSRHIRNVMTAAVAI